VTASSYVIQCQGFPVAARRRTTSPRTARSAARASSWPGPRGDERARPRGARPPRGGSQGKSRTGRRPGTRCPASDPRDSTGTSAPGRPGLRPGPWAAWSRTARSACGGPHSHFRQRLEERRRKCCRARAARAISSAAWRW
jgi:hypothetical protein